MAATNFTPIQLYHSTTASAAPVAGNLANGELAINITDGKLFYKDNGGNVQVLATKGTGTIGGSNTQVQYNSSGALAGSSNFTFNGTTATINTLNLTNALGTTYGGTGLNSYTTGDIVYASASNTLSKLTIGTNGYILTSNGTIPTWTAGSSISVNTADNLSGGAAGSVPYQSGPGATTFLSIGTANRVLTSSGTAPQWVTSLTGLTGVSSSGLTNTSLTSGRVVYSTTGGAQTDSASLTFNGTTLTAGGFATGGSSTLDKLVKIGDSAFNLPAVLSATAPAKLYVSTATVTDASSAGGATNTLGAISSFGSTTVAASNTGVTYTNLATLYIAGAPTAGTNITITNPYSLYIAAGAAYFGGGLTFAGQLNVTDTTDASSTTTGSIKTAGGVGIAKSLWVGLDANIYGITVGRGAGAVSNNTAVGASALAANTSGTSHTAIGFNALLLNTTGTDNTALGREALRSNTTASGGTAVGGYALYSNTTGANNVALGINAMFTNTTGANNTALGYGAMQLNTTASSNTAVGYQAAYTVQTGARVVAVGYLAAYSNTGNGVVAIGANALRDRTAGDRDTAVGDGALASCSTGFGNSAFGSTALGSLTTGSSNVAVGFDSAPYLTVGDSNVVVGYQTMFYQTTGSQNIAVGRSALQGISGGSNTGTANVAIGHVAAQNNTTGGYSVFIGFSSGINNKSNLYNVAVGADSLQGDQPGDYNTAIGLQALRYATGGNNTAVGANAGNAITTGTKNTILGKYNGNQGGLDIRTANNYIVLADGDGNIGAFSNVLANNSRQFNARGSISAASGSASSQAWGLTPFNDNSATVTSILRVSSSTSEWQPVCFVVRAVNCAPGLTGLQSAWWMVHTATYNGGWASFTVSDSGGTTAGFTLSVSDATSGSTTEAWLQIRTIGGQSRSVSSVEVITYGEMRQLYRT